MKISKLVLVVCVGFMAGIANASSLGAGSDASMAGKASKGSIARISSVQFDEPGIKTGEAKEFVPRTKEEENVKKQFYSFFHYIDLGDKANAVKYLMYPDYIDWLHKQAPEYTLAEVKSMSEDVLFEMYQTTRYLKTMKGISNVAVKMTDMKYKQKVGNNLIYAFEYAIQFKYEGQLLYSPDISLVISLDNGKSFYFLALSPDSPEILKPRFSQSVIDKVMSYYIPY